MGIASGLYLTGKRPVVFMQNSGLCNVLNPLTSLNLIYKIPLLLVITLRGEPGSNDAPQHKIMGQKTKDFLDILDIEYKYLTSDVESFKKDLAYLKTKLEKDLKPVSFLLQRGVLERDDSNKNDVNNIVDYELTRRTAINETAKSLDNNCLVITTTGKITREYYFCKDKPENNFYMIGSMGCASAIGLGVATGIKGDKKVVVIDGDGAVLMKMGSLSTIGKVSPNNLIHIVLDNQCHESTGSQETASSVAALDKIAQSCGYANIYRITRVGGIRKAIRESLQANGPSFILIKISKMNEKNDRLERPEESPEQIKEQFIKRLKE